MRDFPGRTLEELDGIDYARLRRAKRSLEIERLESVRLQQAQGLLKGHQVTAKDWEALGRHEEIMDRYVELYQQPN